MKYENTTRTLQRSVMSCQQAPAAAGPGISTVGPTNSWSPRQTVAWRDSPLVWQTDNLLDKWFVGQGPNSLGSGQQFCAEHETRRVWPPQKRPVPSAPPRPSPPHHRRGACPPQPPLPRPLALPREAHHTDSPCSEAAVAIPTASSCSVSLWCSAAPLPRPVLGESGSLGRAPSRALSWGVSVSPPEGAGGPGVLTTGGALPGDSGKRWAAAWHQGRGGGVQPNEAKVWVEPRGKSWGGGG